MVMRERLSQLFSIKPGALKFVWVAATEVAGGTALERPK
jgi:hypothetical protein